MKGTVPVGVDTFLRPVSSSAVTVTLVPDGTLNVEGLKVRDGVGYFTLRL
jgi:hypothetical protein